MSANDRLDHARALLEKFSRTDLELDTDDATTGRVAVTADTAPIEAPEIKLSKQQKKAKQRLKNKAIYYLSLREYSCQELKDKLRAGIVKDNFEKSKALVVKVQVQKKHALVRALEDDFSDDFEAGVSVQASDDDAVADAAVDSDWHNTTADAVVDDFRARGWLSDERFTEQVVQARKAKFGSNRIAHELRQKGIEDSLISAAIASVKVDELASALDICRKKYKTTPQTREEWAKQARFLQSRGFGFDVIKKALNHKTTDFIESADDL